MGAMGLIWAARLLYSWFGRAPRPEPGVSAELNPMPIRDHERRDANAKWIFGLVGFLFIFGIGLHFILAGFLFSLKRGPAPSDAWRPSLQGRPPRPAPPPFPRLQVSAPEDLQTFQERVDAELTNYGWINRTAGVVRIPIERAMELTLQQGFPVRAQTNERSHGASSYDLIRQRSLHRENDFPTRP